MTRRAAASAAAVALALAGHAPALHAVPLAWPIARFDYRVGRVNAADALSELSRRSGVAIDIDARVSCRLDLRDALPPQRFVDWVARTCGLGWYYDGAVLQLVAPDAFERAAVRLNYATPAELRATLARQRIVDRHWRPDGDDAARIVRVAGPPRYVALVLAAARALDRAAQARVPTETRAFKLRARAAADRVVRGDAGDASLPGLATRLRRRLEQDGAAPRAMPGVREFTASLPIVDADAYSNTVLIRDVPARLARDARLVAQLDTLPASIRVDAFGATLQPAQLDALGLRWRDDAGTSAAPGGAGGKDDTFRLSGRTGSSGASGLPGSSRATGAANAAAASGPPAASGAVNAAETSNASAPRVAIATDGCAQTRARIAELVAHGAASIDVDGSTLTFPDGSADFGRLRQAFVASNDGDAPSLDARRNGFAMRVTPRETAQAGRYALDMRIVERWADGDGRAAGAASRDSTTSTTSTTNTTSMTLAAGECAAIALPPAAGRGAQRLVLVTPRATPADPASASPPALSTAPASAPGRTAARATAKPSARAPSPLPSHAHPLAAQPVSPKPDGLGLRIQTRLIGN